MIRCTHEQEIEQLRERLAVAERLVRVDDALARQLGESIRKNCRAIEGARRFVDWFDTHEQRLRETYIPAEFYELQEIADQNGELLK